MKNIETSPRIIQVFQGFKAINLTCEGDPQVD